MSLTIQASTVSINQTTGDLAKSMQATSQSTSSSSSGTLNLKNTNAATVQISDAAKLLAQQALEEAATTSDTEALSDTTKLLVESAETEKDDDTTSSSSIQNLASLTAQQLQQLASEGTISASELATELAKRELGSEIDLLA